MSLSCAIGSEHLEGIFSELYAYMLPGIGKMEATEKQGFTAPEQKPDPVLSDY